MVVRVAPDALPKPELELEEVAYLRNTLYLVFFVCFSQFLITIRPSTKFRTFGLRKSIEIAQCHSQIVTSDFQGSFVILQPVPSNAASLFGRAGLPCRRVLCMRAVHEGRV